MTTTQPTYVVIGNPIAHSKSPQIHALFAAQFPNHSAVEGFLYDRLLAPLDGFTAAVDAFAAAGGRGANVTVPFKEDAFRFVEGRLTSRASLAGAVNTLALRSDGLFYGDNTDGAGLISDLLRYSEIKQKKVLLLGAGGAARGALGPLKRENPSLIVVANRSLHKAELLVQSIKFGNSTELQYQVGSVGSMPLAEIQGQFDIVINSTSASLAGERLPIKKSVFAPNALAYDMMYGKAETPFLAQAREAGVELRVDGLGMLVGQAAEAFELWTGLRPDVEPVLQWMREQL
ncbi:shikimate dehydrogenase [Deefgea rivuli]|uniref:shikimate dehydrogenase n=1 Tax=Deefgea rivuli TaxID=400948 RepID=UPI00047F0CEF|nr:shikimate dehydrogenase [Deefgea rivuli]